MTVAAQKIVKQALALSEGERALVVSELLKSIPSDSDALSQAEWDAAWKVELERRIEEMESGEDSSVPLDEVLAGLEKPVRKP